MKRYVKASKVDTFLKYHEDEDNWVNNRDGFDKMYAILEKYDDSNGNDTVDVTFMKATPEDQDRMLRLITPGPKLGQSGYASKLYNDALSGMYGKEYSSGVADIVQALVKEGLLDESFME